MFDFNFSSCFSFSNSALISLLFLDNSLTNAGYDKNIIAHALSELGFDENVRAENLSLDDYRKLLKFFL